MEELQKYKAVFAAVGVFIILGIVIFGSIAFYERNGKMSVTINTLPDDSIVTLNNVTLSSPKTYLTPGTYTATIARSGFATENRTVVITEEGQNVFSIALVPITEEARKWAEKHKDEYNQFANSVRNISQNRYDALKQNNPITDKLPYKNLLFSISYRPDEADLSGTRIVLEITASETYRQAALFQIRKWGFDPTDYRINFSDYQNPITS